MWDTTADELVNVIKLVTVVARELEVLKHEMVHFKHPGSDC